VHGVKIRGGIALGGGARRDGDQTKPRQEVQILFDTVFAEAEQPGNGGDARPALPSGAVRIALQDRINGDANGAHLGGVVVNDGVIEAEGVGA
jgi:hypothetical protein